MFDFDFREQEMFLKILYTLFLEFILAKRSVSHMKTATKNILINTTIIYDK